MRFLEAVQDTFNLGAYHAAMAVKNAAQWVANAAKGEKVTYFPSENTHTIQDIQQEAAALNLTAYAPHNQTQAREFNEQSGSDVATATNGNITTVITVRRNLLSSPYCQFGDFFGCAELHIDYLNASTQAAIFSFIAGIDLQSVKKMVVTNGNSHMTNAADSAVLAYTWACLQTAATYLDAMNKTAGLITAQNAPGQLALPCAWTTPQNQNMYATYDTSNIALQTCTLLQSVLNGLTVGCESEASKEAAKLYGLIALVALLAIPAVLIYSKYKTGSFFSLCSNNSRDRANEPSYTQSSTFGGYNA